MKRMNEGGQCVLQKTIMVMKSLDFLPIGKVKICLRKKKNGEKAKRKQNFFGHFQV